MDDERDTSQEPTERGDEQAEGPGGHNDNPPTSDDAGEKGAGTATGAIGGGEGTEPNDDEARSHERP